MANSIHRQTANGKLYSLNTRCVDQNLSAQGQEIFNRSIQVCETIVDNKRIDGSTFYFTELSVMPKSASGEFLRLTIDQTAADVFKINPIPGAKSVIEFHYTGRQRNSTSYNDFEARFYRQAN